MLDQLRTKIFADGADIAGILELANDPRIQGFTTNPTLMRQAGIAHYEGFARQLGHTGDVDAAVKAIQTVDAQLRRIVATVHESGGACIITADHGNAEHMLNDDGSPNTAHTTNPVPLLITASGLDLRSGGILAAVAPTVLDLLGIEGPPEMTGKTLVNR